MLKMNTISMKTIILLCCQLNGSLEGAKILAVFGVPQPGENMFTTALLNTLHARGHEITAIIKFPHEIQLHSGIEKIVIKSNNEIKKAFWTFSANTFGDNFYPNLKELCDKSELITKNIVSHPKVQDILQHQQYDLILLCIWLSEALYGLGEYFNVPIVGVSTFSSSYPLDLLVGNISPVSIIPTMFLQHTYEATFLQRCLNVALSVIDKMIYSYLYLPGQQKLYQEVFPNATLSFDQARRNFSLVLINQHFSLRYPRPYVPNMIEVAGLHIEDRSPSLPLKVQKFLDASSTRPIFYIRLQVGASKFGLSINNFTLLCHILKQLNFKAIWLVEEKTPVAENYSNILQVSNVSHFAILAHPQVKLLITHGEILSVIEAAHYGKPILGIPIFADQFINLNLATSGGFGLSLNHKSLNATRFRATIIELLNNPTYTLKAQQLSRIFRDQPIRPRDKAVYWIEYILRHNGAAHLRGKGRFLNCWQFNNIDVFATYFAIFSVVVFLIWSAMKCLYTLIKRRNTSSSAIKFKSN